MTETQGNDFQAGGCGPTERKRLHVITWGCQMNVYDSGRMADVLAPLGWVAFQANLLVTLWDGFYGWGHIFPLTLAVAGLMIFNNLLGFTGISVFAR